jgi:hypothetical protein
MLGNVPHVLGTDERYPDISILDRPRPRDEGAVMILRGSIAFSLSVEGLQVAWSFGGFRTKIDARSTVVAALAARDDEIAWLKAGLAALQTAGDE